MDERLDAGSIEARLRKQVHSVRTKKGGEMVCGDVSSEQFVSREGELNLEAGKP